MTVASSTHLSIKRDISSNRCPLKVSLVGVVQGAPKEINSDNAMFSILVNDYARKIYNFIIKVVFSHHNSRFKHFMNSTWLIKSVLFVMGQMDIIEKDLYIYTSDISYVDISTVTKKKVIGSESNSALYSKEKSESVSDLNFEVLHSSKCVRVVDEKDDYFEYCDKGSIEVNKECKEKIIQPVVHNTRKWSESSKIVNSNEK
ncbi:1236_t:CDS:2, partial [Gigaspora rosea]